MKTTYTYRDELDNLASTLQAAKHWTHPQFDLSADALATERRSRVNAATEQRMSLIETARNHVFPAAAKALTDLAAQYSNPPITDAGQVADRRNRWDRAVMLAERGQTLGSLIDAATLPDLDAIAEWAPTWVRAEQLDVQGDQHAHSYEPNPVAWVHDCVTVRYATLNPNGPAARALVKVRDALDVAITTSYHEPMGLAFARDQLDSMSDREALLTYRTDGRVITLTELAGQSTSSVFLNAPESRTAQGTAPMGAAQ